MLPLDISHGFVTLWLALGLGVPVYSSRGSGPQPKVKNPANESTLTVGSIAICGENTLTKGVLSVWNFSARMCNQRRPNNGPIPSQRQNKPMFSNRVFRATSIVLDLCTGDAPRSLREASGNANKNVGVRASRNSVNKGGVAYGDESRIVSLDSLLVKGLHHQTPEIHKGIPKVSLNKGELWTCF
jgi:hypothetical protein